MSARRGVGAVLEVEKRIPRPRGVQEAAAALGVDFLPLALGGGEDYELLLAVEAERAEELRKSGSGPRHRPAGGGNGHPGPGRRGGEMDIASTGWDHFAVGEV